MAYRCYALLIASCWIASAGCQLMSSQRAGADAADAADAQPPLSRGVGRVARFLSGKEQIDRQRAITLYREGDAMFRRAAELPREDAQPMFAKAAKVFTRAAEAHPGSALEQDALFLAGESHFFADQLTRAEDSYVKLQKEHPRNRHSDRVAARLFAIAQYWIATAKAPRRSIMLVNFTDPSRPYLDASGHGIRVLDHMRYDDPTGRLADDATMAAAVEHFRKGNYLEADQFLTDLRETFPDSEHQFNAHLLGLRCKMEMYAGAAYSGLVLDEAEKLIERMRRVFPAELREPEHRELIARTAAEVEFRQAERLWTRADYREKQGNYGGANFYLQELLEKHPSTPFAEQAREHLVENSKYPATPPQRLAFLAKLFPESKPAKPLLSTDGTVLR